MAEKKQENALPKSVILTAWFLVLGALAPMLDSTMVNIAVPDLVKSLHTTLAMVQWTITGYVLATGVAVPFSGWLVKRFDGKWVYLVAELVFLIGSIWSALSGSIEMLIAARLFQGFGAGLIIPLLTTLLVQTGGQGSMGRLMAVVGLPIMIGPILGPVVGGILIQHLSWQWIFWVNVPVVLVALVGIFWKLPNFPASDKQASLDFVGTALLAVSSSTMIYGITRAASQASFNNNDTKLYAGVGLVLLLVYIAWAAFKKDKAVLPLHLFKFKSFSASMTALFIAGLATNGPMLLLTMYFQDGRGFSAINAALALIPQGIGMLLARPLIGKMTDRIGARLVVLVSLIFTLIGTLPFVYIDGDTSLWIVSLVLFVRGIGTGGMIMPLMADAYTGMSNTDVPAASVGTRIMQNIGGAFSSAILATIMANYIHNKMDHLTTAVKAGNVHVDPTQLQTYITHMAHTFQMQSFQQGFLVTVWVSLAIIVPAVFLTNKKREK